MVHITNGDCAVAVLSRAVQGTFLPWRDVLHEGPVDAGLPLEKLSKLRAGFIASAGWAAQDVVEKDFAQRDAALRAAAHEDEVVLWFEHDLYDQLQLLQLFDWFGAHPHPRLMLVCEAEYLGTMTVARAGELFAHRRPVTTEQLRAGAAAWHAFGSAKPRTIALAPVPELPFLAPALRRVLEELPWTTDGLSRLERQVLEALQDEALPFAELFARAHHRREDPIFLGDTVLAWRLEGLARDGLVSKQGERFAMTERGRAVLARQLDAWSFPRTPRWIGGYQLRSASLRWDPDSVRAVSFG
jgi:hypothetical protein